MVLYFLKKISKRLDFQVWSNENIQGVSINWWITCKNFVMLKLDNMNYVLKRWFVNSLLIDLKFF